MKVSSYETRSNRIQIGGSVFCNWSRRPSRISPLMSIIRFSFERCNTAVSLFCECTCDVGQSWLISTRTRDWRLSHTILSYAVCRWISRTFIYITLLFGSCSLYLYDVTITYLVINKIIEMLMLGDILFQNKEINPAKRPIINLLRCLSSIINGSFLYKI